MLRGFRVPIRVGFNVARPIATAVVVRAVRAMPLRFVASSSSASSPSAIAAATEAPETKRIRVYTRTGDAGMTSLFNQERRAKTDPALNALGDVDELNACIGVAREHCARAGNGIGPQLEEIQARLLDAGAHVATPRTKSSAPQIARTAFDASSVERLESWIDAMDDRLPPLKNFILPSGGLSATALHVSRAVCRRAERAVVALVLASDCDPVVQRYLNRLSDYLFVSARFAAQHDGASEVTWKKPTERAKARAAASASASASASSATEAPKS